VKAALTALCIVTAPAVWAADLVGPGAVFDGGWDCRPHALGVPGWLDCLAAAGASPEAVAFAAHLASPEPPEGAGEGLPGILVDFRETGTVDVGTVVFPDLANSNEQMFFLNGDPPVLHPYAVLGAAQPDDAASQALLRPHTQAMMRGPAGIGAHRVLPDGMQRFVVRDDLVDGCRACEPLGVSVALVEFRDGVASGSRVLGYAGLEVEDADPVAAIAGGDTRVLQFRLNLAGYAAGAMDGRAGPQTRAALAEFRADHCPSATGPVGAPEAAVLVAIADRTPTPPCP
jgi:hypothetical protein